MVAFSIVSPNFNRVMLISVTGTLDSIFHSNEFTVKIHYQ